MCSADNQPLLFLDSGIGGLTIADAVGINLPHHRQIYVSDYAGFPYGTKSEVEIVNRLPLLLARLADAYNPAIITIACNTASTIALDAVRQVVDIPVVGTVPAIKPAAALTKTNVIGVLGTQATVRQPYVANLAREFAPDANIIHYGAPDLVTIAEDKVRGAHVDPEKLQRAIAPMMADPLFNKMDVLVLSCTHFPFLRRELAQLLPTNCQLIDGAQGISRRIATLLHRHRQFLNRASEPVQPGLFLTTGDPAQLKNYSTALQERGFLEKAHFPLKP